MKTVFCLTVGAAFVAALAGCDAAPAPAAAKPVDSLTLRQGYIIDSIFPMEEMLSRFRAGVGEAPEALVDGAASRDSLVRGLVRALAERESAALERMRIDRAEFAWLYFPASPFVAPPYELPPEVLWLQISEESGKGLVRAMRAVARGSSYVGHWCAAEPREARGVRIWDECVVRWRAPRGTEEGHRLFGSILEHGGRFKFVSYANPL